ncbi:MAG TPA: DUF3299 domain-containing protein [Burkholderiales bacterium]|nr:DUF3299 domain-containing protein [Burkholderiales bacterium]
MKRFPWLMGLLLAAPVAWAQQGAVPGKDLYRSPAPVDAPLPPSPYLDKPLPELKGVVSWKTLAGVTPVRQKERFVPQFSKEIMALDKKEVKLQGFMMPLDMGERQKRFLLVAMPPSCAFCLPGGPDQLVEVLAKTPIKYGFDPIVVSGRFAVLSDDPMGLYYRLTDAVLVSQ